MSEKMNAELFDEYLAEAGYDRADAAERIGMTEGELDQAVAGERELTGAQRWELAKLMGIARNPEAQEDVFWPE